MHSFIFKLHHYSLYINFVVKWLALRNFVEISPRNSLLLVYRVYGIKKVAKYHFVFYINHFVILLCAYIYIQVYRRLTWVLYWYLVLTFLPNMIRNKFKAILWYRNAWGDEEQSHFHQLKNLFVNVTVEKLLF